MHALLLVILPALVAQDGNEAEKLFRKMEMKITQAKSLELVFDLTMDGRDKLTVKGKFLLASGNKARMELDVDSPREKNMMIIIGDGAAVQMVEGDKKGFPETTSDHLSQVIRDSLARSSLMAGMEGIDKKRSLKLTTADFQLGAKEAVNGHMAQIVTYKLINENAKDRTINVQVWIDVKTSLPLRRVLTIERGERKESITENYTTLTLDPMLDAKLFELPK